jgi:flagellar hook-associated protein 3 FlgL
MSMRVATFDSTNTLLQSALRIQSQESDVTQQEASGVKSTDYGGFGSTSGKIVSLQASVTQSKAYSNSATLANDRVQQMYSSIGSMTTLLTSFKADLNSFDQSTATTTTSTLASEASQTLKSLQSQMNTQYAGDYLFGGSNVTTAPVDTSTMTAQTDPTTSDTSYYKGDDAIASVKVGNDNTVTYGVTADNSAFEAAIRGLNTIAAGNMDSTAITSASNLIDTAVSGLTTIQANLSLNSKALEDASSDQSDYQTFIGTTLSDLTSVDVAQASSSLSSYSNQLQAAYSAIGKIQNLSLTNYLK